MRLHCSLEHQGWWTEEAMPTCQASGQFLTHGAMIVILKIVTATAAADDTCWAVARPRGALIRWTETASLLHNKEHGSIGTDDLPMKCTREFGTSVVCFKHSYQSNRWKGTSVLQDRVQLMCML